MDEQLRILARLAASGDEEAAARLMRLQQRIIPRAAYYMFYQNNVAGIRVEDQEKGVGRYVIIEAFDDEHASERLRGIVGDVMFWDHDICCGSRWHNEAPVRFERLIDIDNRYYSSPTSTTYVHFLDWIISPLSQKVVEDTEGHSRPPEVDDID